MLRAVIYIDGQNLHYQLKDIGILEKDVDWTKFFNRLVPSTHRLIRAYWYQAARIQPWELRDARPRQRCPEDIGLDEYKQRAVEYYERERDRLEGIQNNVYRRIAENFPDLEFRYVGVLKVDPLAVWYDRDKQLRVGDRVGEKGVDVAMAVDMVRHAPEYDLAIIISGDADFVPAIQAVKDSLRRVVGASVLKGSPPKRQGQARRLRSLCDEQIGIYESDMKGIYRWPARGSDPAV